MPEYTSRDTHKKSPVSRKPRSAENSEESSMLAKRFVSSKNWEGVSIKTNWKKSCMEKTPVLKKKTNIWYNVPGKPNFRTKNHLEKSHSACWKSNSMRIIKKLKGGPLETIKLFRKMRIWNSLIVSKNVKGIFWTSILLQNLWKIEGDPLRMFFEKKSHNAEKKLKRRPFSLARYCMFRGKTGKKNYFGSVLYAKWLNFTL